MQRWSGLLGVSGLKEFELLSSFFLNLFIVHTTTSITLCVHKQSNTMNTFNERLSSIVHICLVHCVDLTPLYDNKLFNLPLNVAIQNTFTCTHGLT